MKLTNAEILNLANAITEAGRDGEKPRNLPWRVAYALARTSSALKPHLEAISEARKSIMAEHAPGKDAVQPGEPGHAGIIKALNELNRTEVEVAVHRFGLADIEGLSMAPVVLAALLPLIDEPEQAKG